MFEQVSLLVGHVPGVNGLRFPKTGQALEVRRVGDRGEVTLSSKDSFGERKPELSFADDIANVPPEYRRLGAGVTFENGRREQIELRVTRIENARLTVDGNHRRAGQKVKFIVTVVAVRHATLDEVANGMPADGGAAPCLH